MVLWHSDGAHMSAVSLLVSQLRLPGIAISSIKEENISVQSSVLRVLTSTWVLLLVPLGALEWEDVIGKVTSKHSFSYVL